MSEYTLSSLWRYPVKSMAGEEIEDVEFVFITYTPVDSRERH